MSIETSLEVGDSDISSVVLRSRISIVGVIVELSMLVDIVEYRDDIVGTD